MKTILIILSILFVLPSLADNCGRIESLRGSVEILRVTKGDASADDSVREIRKASKRMKLLCSDVIVTRKAARTKIRFKNKSTMTLGPNSRLEVLNYLKKDSRASVLKLTYGKVRAFVDKDKPTKKLPKKGEKNTAKRFYITTPSAVAGVRGTDFFISYEPNTSVTEQATLEGEVEVFQKHTGRKVTVKKGRQVTVEKKAPPKPKKLTEIAVELKAKEDAKDEKNQEKEVLGDKKYPTITRKDLLSDLLEIEQVVAPVVLQKAKPLKATAIVPEVKEEIRQTSVMVKNDSDFASPEAVEVLGKPDTWKPPSDEVPVDLKNIKEVF